MGNLAHYVVTNDDGYPQLTHFSGSDDERACFVMFVEAGTNLDEMLAAVYAHECPGDTGGGAQ